MDPDPGLLLGIGGCLLVLALISAVDAAFTSVSWRHVNTILAQRAERSPRLAQLLNDPYRLKATIILLNTSATIAAAALTLEVARQMQFNSWLQTGSLVLLLFAILVVSAALPKALAVRDAPAAVRLLAAPVSFTTWLLSPLIWSVTMLLRPLALLVGSPSMTRTPLVFEEELRLLVHAGEEEGFVEHEEREMIEGVFAFSETIVREVMVPRVDVVALEVDTPLAEALQIIIEEGHSRIPVYDETIDSIVGILYAKDLLPALRDHQPDRPIQPLLRPAYYVPETVNVGSLLKDLQQAKVHMAVVVDEYGGTAGLVTIEDLIEEIVGEIQDEYDTEDPPIEILNEQEVIVNARTLIDDFNELTGLKLEATESDRLGGLVYEKLGRMPHVGDEVLLDGAVARVLSVNGLSVEKLHIRLYLEPGETNLLSQKRNSETQDTTPEVLLVQLLATPTHNGTGATRTNGSSAIGSLQPAHSDSDRSA